MGTEMITKKFLFILISLFITSSTLVSQVIIVPCDFSTIALAASSLHGSGMIIVRPTCSPQPHIENSLVTIPAGVTCLIEAGATVTFKQGIIVNGNFATDGTEQNKIVLNFAAGKKLTINASDSTIFKHTIFQGISSSGWRGISLAFRNSIYFLDCEIRNSNYGIAANSSYIYLKRTRFPLIFIGLDLATYSHANVYQNNIFKCVDFAIYGDATSTISAGNSHEFGFNSFRRPCTDYIYSEYPYLYAQFNYWEGFNCLEDFEKFPSNMIVLPAFIYDQNPPLNQGYIHDDYKEKESGIFLKGNVVENNKSIEKIHGIEELDQATQLLFSKKYDEALPELHKLVDNYRDGFVGKRALVFIENVLTETYRNEEILPMLNSYSIDDSKVTQFAEYRKGYQYLHLGEYDKGIEIMKGIEFSEEDADLRQARLYDLGVAYHNLLDKKEEAYYYFNELVKTYPDCQLTKVATTFYGDEYGLYENSTIDKDKEIAVPTETKLFPNYPNPFNPSTVIKYQLSDASQISLKVYDVMGREVATLVNSFQEQGVYNVTFNANGLASGIYLYKLNAGGKQLINKMLLMK